MEFYESQARQFYRLLNHGEHWTQGHCHNTVTGKVIDRRLLHGEEEVIAWLKENNGRGNIFVGRNAREANGGVRQGGCLSLDIDPVRPKGTAATEDQHRAALQAGRLLVRHFGYGVLCSSGNGALVLFPLKEAVAKEQAEQWGKAVEEEARLFLIQAGYEGTVDVDSTWDAARLVKAMGCVSTKGDSSLWRHARIITSSVHTGNDSERFFDRLNKAVSRNECVRPTLPDVPKGELDRSKADMALANRLKLQGFTSEDAYRALCQYATRPGREDDYKRIIQKVYGAERSNVADMVSGTTNGPILLWTPESGSKGYETPDNGRYLTTGFKSVDSIITGLLRGAIHTVATRTDCGKTAFIINTAVENYRANNRILLFSTENQYKDIWHRFFATALGIRAAAIQDKKLEIDEQARLDAFKSEFYKTNSFAIADQARPSIEIIRKAFEQHKPDLVLLDYFQHFEAKDAKLLAEFVMRLHDLIREYDTACVITAMCHDRHDLQTRKLLPVNMSDIKDCHTLPDESRTVMLLDWDRDNSAELGAVPVKVVFGKHKGARKPVILKLNRAIPRFEHDGNP